MLCCYYLEKKMDLNSDKEGGECERPKEGQLASSLRLVNLRATADLSACARFTLMLQTSTSSRKS